MKKLLFICKQRSNYDYGQQDFQDFGTDKRNGSYGITNSCNLIKSALEEKFAGVECKVVTVADNNCIDREVFNYKPTHVFIEALWVVPSKFYELLPLHPSVQWSVRIHSKTPFLSNEGIAFNWIVEYLQVAKRYCNFSISGNDKEFVNDLRECYSRHPRERFEYLPNLYLGDFSFRAPRATANRHELNVGCFGAIRPMKNQLQQAVAAVALANSRDKHLKFHMNGRAEQQGGEVLKNIQALLEGSWHELVLHGWHTHADFLELVATMDIGLQVSFSESFNIVAADFVMQNIPIVVSEDITWASSLYKAKSTCAEDIKNKMAFALRFRNTNMQYANKINLLRYNNRALDAWSDYLIKETCIPA